jgi:5,10-methylenetetrahydromethanopterin reductase
VSTERAPRKTIGLALWGNEPVADTIAHVELAERIGLDGVWLVDSQLICREVYVTLAACAARTARIRLATGVTVPRTRHPSVTASALATLDELSGGRAVAGIGTGNTSLRTIGQPPARLAELEAFVAALRRLLGREAARFDDGAEGRITWLDRPARVPLFIAATGPRLTRAAARLGDGVILLQGIAPDLLGRGLALVEEGAREAGRAVETVCWTYIALADDAATARDRARARVAAALQVSRPEWFEGEDRDTVARLHREYDVLEHATSRPRHAALVPDRLVHRYAIAGTPREVRERLAELAARPGFQHIVLSPQVAGPGALPIDHLLRTLAADVLPHL